jgi:hypothetical protein
VEQRRFPKARGSRTPGGPDENMDRGSSGSGTHRCRPQTWSRQMCRSTCSVVRTVAAGWEKAGGKSSPSQTFRRSHNPKSDATRWRLASAGSAAGRYVANIPGSRPASRGPPHIGWDHMSRLWRALVQIQSCAIPRSGSPGSIETRAMQPVRLARSSASLLSVHRVYRFYTALS